MTTEQFIEKARKIHGDRYDYSKVDYKTTRTKVCIICPIHGEFWQTPAQHLAGKKCRACAAEEAWSKRKTTKEEFIKMAREKHGDKYDYSKVDFHNMTTKVCIICPIHGEFWQTPKSHLKYRCPKCGDELKNTRQSSTEEFIEKARKVHGNKYDYSKVKYVNSGQKVCIICQKHGEFWQTPSRHLSGGGCSECFNEKRGDSRRLSHDMFLSKVLNKYGTSYDMSNTKYVNSRTLIETVCKTHGVITDYPLHFLKYGCIECYKERKKSEKDKEKQQKKLLAIEWKNQEIEEKTQHYLEKFRLVHGDKYDYSKVDKIQNAHTKICIICPIHGEFWQRVSYHSKGCSCPKCAIEKIRQKLTMTKEDFVSKANKIHSNKYDYSKVEYINYVTKVCIICPKHGEFWQTPSMHISEHQGCPECATLSSYAENEIYDFICNELNIEAEKRNKTIIGPKELDIYLKSYNIAFEYDGLRWHSEKFGKGKTYHLNKTLECEKKGVRLFHIFEDEWEERKEIVKHKISHLLSRDTSLETIHGRKCVIIEINNETSKTFLNTFHIQGSALSSVRLGAFYKDKLIGVMTFLKTNKDGKFILNRFASDYNYRINGIGGKLLSYFIKRFNPNEIITFADRRWTTDKENNLYTKIGFKLQEILPPDYSYVTETDSERKRIHKFNFRKQILHKKYGFSLTMTENEMAEELNAYKIWDCGLLKYSWKNNNLKP